MAAFMCGICGAVAKDARHPIVGERALIAMRDAMVHRGPDDFGVHLSRGVALGARRLSIIDLSANGHMPMATSDGRLTLVYNGELYNFRELRKGLEAKGHVFRSNTDTEVVLTMYSEHGPRMLEHLNGMFAIALWDEREQVLFLARDRLGIKPLYYHLENDCFAFASEAKALFAAEISPELDPCCWEEMLCFRYVAGEKTPFKEVRRLLPGHWATWRDGRLVVRRWWNLGKRARACRGLVSDPEGWYVGAFDGAVQRQLVGDVSVGVLLSGGLDSGSIVASLGVAKQARRASFTVRFDEPDYDEGPQAHEVARMWGMDSHDLVVSGDRLLERVRRATWFNDEPLVHGDETHLLAVSVRAKELVTVLLSGEGGDETLGGYVRYQPLRCLRALASVRPILPKINRIVGFGGRIHKLSRLFEQGGWDKLVLFNACDVLPDDLEELGFKASTDFAYREAVLDEARDVYPDDMMRQVMYYDQHTFLCSTLDRNDKMTMAASIECRVPFLDHQLIEGLAALTTSQLFPDLRRKPLLRRALGGRLPKAIRRHKKWGFGVPWQRYMRQNAELRSFVLGLPEREPIKSSPFDRLRLARAIRGFLAGDNARYMLIRQLMNVGVWYDTVCASHKSAGVSIGAA